MARYVFDSKFETSFVDVCSNSVSMAQAALTLGMNYKTVCFHAKRLNCFKANQSGKNLSKKPSRKAVELDQIFSGQHQTYQSHKLKKRLLAEGVKKYVCESCGLSNWLSYPISLELHHVDGNRKNNSLVNLKLLCPNCHAQTDNYRAKNIRNLSAWLETAKVEPLKFGEAFYENDGNPEPSPNRIGEGVET